MDQKSQYKSLVRGLWPSDAFRSLDRLPQKSVNQNDIKQYEEGAYDIAFSVVFRSSDNKHVRLKEVQDYMKSYNKDYDLDDNSCTHFALSVLEKAGFKINSDFGRENHRKPNKAVLGPGPLLRDIRKSPTNFEEYRREDFFVG